MRFIDGCLWPVNNDKNGYTDGFLKLGKVAMQAVDTLIHCRWIIPVEPEHVVYENHSLVINDGRILAILPTPDCAGKFNPRQELQRPRHALIPGFVNSHTHAAMNLFRGLADDLPLMEWLNDHIWPAEGQWISPDFVFDGTRLAIAEMLRSGTTCFNDMYFFPDKTALAASQAGIRAAVGMIMIDFPTAWASQPDEYLSKGLALHDQYQHDPLISTLFAPHAPYTVSDGPLASIRTLAEELDVGIHMHLHETAFEVSQALENNALKPLQRLDHLGLLSPNMLAVHMTQLDNTDIELIASRGVHVIHCPESNLKLASGFCPVQALLDAGVNVALGTDGAASNNDLDMLAEMRTAALLAKAVAQDASALPAEQALRMATLNGARALGLGDETGSLEQGKLADIVAIDLDELESQPLYHPVSQIVYTACRQQISDVWVGGRHLLSERQLTTIDRDALLSQVRIWQDRIAHGKGA